ncbi:hypothetical protein V8V80_24830 [Niallia taxi]
MATEYVVFIGIEKVVGMLFYGESKDWKKRISFIGLNIAAVFGLKITA